MEGGVSKTDEFRKDRCRMVGSVCLSWRRYGIVGKYSMFYLFHCHPNNPFRNKEAFRSDKSRIRISWSKLTSSSPLRLLNLKSLRSSVSMQVPLNSFSSSMWRQPCRALLLNLRYRSFSKTRTTSRELPGCPKLRPYCCELRLQSCCQTLHGPLWRPRIRPGMSSILYDVSSFLTDVSP